MTKTARTPLLVTATVFLLAAMVALGVFLPKLSAQEPDAAPTPDITAPALSPNDSRYVVLNSEDVTDYPTSRKSEPNKSFNVGYGTPPGFPAGVPLPKDAWVQWQFYEYEDGERSYMFVGNDDDFQGILDQFAYTGWKLDSDETLGESTRIITFSNEVNTADVVRIGTVAGQDEWYSIRVTPK